VSLKKGRVPGVARFEPRSWTGEIKGPTLPSPHDPIKSTILSIVIRNSVARRVPIATAPMLGRGSSNYGTGSVTQSQGFRSLLVSSGSQPIIRKPFFLILFPPTFLVYLRSFTLRNNPLVALMEFSCLPSIIPTTVRDGVLWFCFLPTAKSPYLACPADDCRGMLQTAFLCQSNLWAQVLRKQIQFEFWQAHYPVDKTVRQSWSPTPVLTPRHRHYDGEDLQNEFS